MLSRAVARNGALVTCNSMVQWEEMVKVSRRLLLFAAMVQGFISRRPGIVQHDTTPQTWQQYQPKVWIEK